MTIPHKETADAPPHAAPFAPQGVGDARLIVRGLSDSPSALRDASDARLIVRGVGNSTPSALGDASDARLIVRGLSDATSSAVLDADDLAPSAGRGSASPPALRGPREAVAELAGSVQPHLVGVRHHSPALAAVVPALLDAARAEVVCVELPVDFQPWLAYLADPATVAPVALSGADEDGRLRFYPFADFSPELAAIRWAREHGVEVLCCDLPMSDPAWSQPGVRMPDPTSPEADTLSRETERPNGEPDGTDLDGIELDGIELDGIELDGIELDGTKSADPELANGAPVNGEPGATSETGDSRPHPMTETAEQVDAEAQAEGNQASGGRRSASGAPTRGSVLADALAASGTGRDGDDMWDRAVEVLAPGCPPEAVRRAALGVGWALRQDAQAEGGIAFTDLAREAHMRDVIAKAAVGGRRVSAIIGAFHAPALLSPLESISSASSSAPVGAAAGSSDGAKAAGDGGGDAGGNAGKEPVSRAVTRSRPVGGSAGKGRREPVTSLIPYAFDLLDSRSGYPAGIRDPRWQQAVFMAGGDPDRIRDAAARAITDLCRELRSAGHTAGTGEAVETLRLACDLARLRGLPAPGRGELLEAVTTALSQGEPLGRGRVLARALDTVLVGTQRGRTAPGTPRSGLGPAVEAELAELRLPCPANPEPREMRLDPLRSDLDARREILLRRLQACGVTYGEALEVVGTGDGTALTTRWKLAWTPAVPALLDLASIRGVTAEMAAEGTLREAFRRESAENGPTGALILGGLRAAAGCDLPGLVAERLADADAVLPATATLPELLEALDLLDGLRRRHLPGTTPEGRVQAGELAVTLLEAAIRGLPGLSGSDQPGDAAALIALATRAGDDRMGLRMDAALDDLARTGSPLIQGAALAARVLLDLDGSDVLGARAAGWVDAATGPDGRKRLLSLLIGLLTAAGPLLQAAPAVLDPLMDRVDGLTDEEFLGRLPALRGGFDTLTPAARTRLLGTVTERLGGHLDLALSAPPALVALWTAADVAGLAALDAVRFPAMSDALAEAGLETPTSASQAEHTTAEHSTTAAQAEPVQATEQAEPAVGTEHLESTAVTEQVERVSATGDAVPRHLAPGDRWRLLLGREPERLPSNARRYASALDELYGMGRGEGASDFGQCDAEGNRGGQETSFPTAREWAGELDALFGAEVREEVLARAADAGRTDVLTELDPAAVRPSVELLTSVLSLAGGMPEQQVARLRPLVRRLIDELTRELATRLRPAMTGLATPRPTRRPGGKLDLPRTLRANLAHARRTDDGRTLVIPERPIFSTRSRREADWRLILVVDVSGSMEASVVWSALTAAVLGGVPTLSTHFLAFSTQVIDLTERVDDPLSLLLEVRVGGGTHIAAGLAHARSLITVPSRTLVVVVSDFEEGYPLGGLLGEVRSLAGSGVHLLGCAALDDDGKPRYSVPIAQQLVAAGMPVAALSPLALARWVGDRLRGEPS